VQLALLLLALGLMANAVLGPLGLGWIQWRLSPYGLNQTYGSDAAALLLGAPIATVTAWLWHRGRRLGVPLALGAALFSLYYAVAEVIGPDYIRYAGNNERFFLLFLAIIVLSWSIAFSASTRLDARPPRPPIWLRRGLAIVLVLGGLLLAFAWGGALIDIAMSGRLSEAYLDAPSGFWIVRIVDVGFLAPVCLATGAGLWRSQPLAIKAAYGVTVFLTLQAAAVLLMAGVMLWRGDPTATPAFAVALVPIFVALATLTVQLLRTYAQGPVGSLSAVPSRSKAGRAADRAWFVRGG
jgi:hypothetical protein